MKTVGLLLASCGLWAQSVVVNRETAKWVQEKGSESVVIREDSATGGLELMVRFPAGHVFAPHWHDSNERIVVLEGRLSLKEGNEEKFVETGGYAFLPAKQPQRLSCASKTRCVFYLAWDGNPSSHPL